MALDVVMTNNYNDFANNNGTKYHAMYNATLNDAYFTWACLTWVASPLFYYFYFTIVALVRFNCNPFGVLSGFVQMLSLIHI